MTNRPAMTLLSPLMPYPPTAGALVHIYHLIHQLVRFYDLDLYVLSDTPERVAWGDLANLCQDVGAFRRQYDRRIGFDPPAVRQEGSPKLTTYLRQRWAQHPPAIVQLEFTSMARYAQLARQVGALTSCTAHVVGFQNQIRRARMEDRVSMRLRRLVGAFSFWQYELRTLALCDLVITLTEQDREVLRRWLPRLPIVSIPSGADLTALQPCFNPQIEESVLFVGNYQHPPNVEGALWLAREVWPLVLRQHPRAKLTLAGRGPTPAIQALASESIRVPGFVPDLRPLYANTSLFVAPIFWGSGMRIKLIEALAAGVPIVTTALAAEGMDVRASALLAENPAAFAQAIVRLLDDRDLRVRLGAAGQLVARRDHDWRRLSERIAGVYAGILASRARGTPS
jgi:glycosyltransferase involved in cell wall biosynthesis